MKKLIFISFLFPLFCMGQDNFNLNQILETSAKKMDIQSKSLQYKLKNINSYTEEYIEYEIKKTYNNNSQFEHLFAEETYYTSSKDKTVSNRIIKYLDSTSQTAYYWNEEFGVLKIQQFKPVWNDINFMAATFNYFSYTKEGLNFLLNPNSHNTEAIEDYVYAEKLIDSSLLCKGLTNINAKPHYIIEHIMKYPSRSYYDAYRYSDYKRDSYSPIMDFMYFYIDTATHIVTKTITFALTNTKDTIFYNNIELMDYAVNNISCLNFNPDDYPAKKIIKETESTKDSCDKGGLVVKDLSGKAPNIEGLDTNNKIVSLHKQKAKCYVIDFMYANCGVCIKNLPFWDEMKTKYNQDIMYFIIDPVDNMNAIKNMISTYNITIPVIQDKDKKARNNYAIYGYPTYYILDENFNILYSSIGSITPCDREDIEKILSSYHNK